MKLLVFSARKVDEYAFTEYKPNTFSVVFIKEQISVSGIRRNLDADAVCVGAGDKVDREVLKAMEECSIDKLVLRCSTVKDIDLEYAKQIGIQVFRSPYASSHAVAELVVTLVLTLNRKLHLANERTSKGNFSIDGLTGFDIRGKTVGLLGNNKIANMVGKIFLGFGAKVLIFDKSSAREQNLDFDYTKDLETVLRNSDIISVHLPNNREYRHVINSKKLNLIKPHAIIVNVSRTPVIKINSLTDALKNKKLGGVAIDVSPDEKAKWNNGPTDHNISTLRLLNNVIITPMISSLTEEGLERRTKVCYSSLMQPKSKYIA